MDHESYRRLAAGAAIDDLDPTERRAYDRHVRSCSACSRLGLELDAVLGELALAAPAMPPPPTLRSAVLGGLLTAAPDRPRTPGGRAARVGPDRRWRLGMFGALAAAATFAIVVVGLGARAIALDAEVAAARSASADARSELATARSELTQARSGLAAARSAVAARAGAVAVMVDPTHRTAAMTAEPVASATRAIVIYRPGSTDAFVIADHLPATPDGMVYQLWSADASGVHPLGTFHHDGLGPFVASFDVDLASSMAAMVTLEPDGGAVAGPGPQVVFGEL